MSAKINAQPDVPLPRKGSARSIGAAVAVLVLLLGFGVLGKLISSFDKTTGGEVALGGPYVTDLRFNLVRITLPDNVQKAVNDAQAAFAKVSEAQAQIAQASAQAAANEQRQKGYEECPTCAQIDAFDALHALPQGITVYAPGNGAALALPTGT